MVGRCHTIVDSPMGPLTLVAEGGVLVNLLFDVSRTAADPVALGERTSVGFEPIVAQLEEYFAGDRKVFDVPLRFEGTPFQETVWRALQSIPYGTTWTYGQLAEEIGRPGASRAVGLANGRNPISIIVPCHRVIGSDGSLTGFGGGLGRKEWLLRHEGALLI